MKSITLLGKVEEKLNSNIINAVTYRIECILKAVLEFMLSQMTSRIRVIYLILIGLWLSKSKLEGGRMNFNMLLLKTL